MFSFCLTNLVGKLFSRRESCKRCSTETKTVLRLLVSSEVKDHRAGSGMQRRKQIQSKISQILSGFSLFLFQIHHVVHVHQSVRCSDDNHRHRLRTDCSVKAIVDGTFIGHSCLGTNLRHQQHPPGSNVTVWTSSLFWAPHYPLRIKMN